jgi:exocyst complex component 2
MNIFSTTTTPQLITSFENLFSVLLTEESGKIRDVLSQLDSQLFKSYTKPHIARLDATIRHGVFGPNWAPQNRGKREAERDPSAYVYEVLLDLVIVHTEVSTTSPALTPRILKTLFEAVTTSLITTFRSLQRCSVSALMQATLDVEFISQTLSSYTTQKASQIQTDIYQVLDSKTDNAARVKLQEELPSLRSILKRLREGTRGEFACFRRPKRTTVGETPTAYGR